MKNFKNKIADLLLPSNTLIEDIKSLDGDIIILGAGGKIGPSLALLTKQTIDSSGQVDKKVIAVSRFSDPNVKRYLEEIEIGRAHV